MAWRMVIGGLVGGALLVTGCATKKFVQEEVAKSQQRTGSEVGRVDKSLGEEKARVDGLRTALSVLALVGLVGLFVARRVPDLPTRAVTGATPAGTDGRRARARAVHR